MPKPPTKKQKKLTGADGPTTKVQPLRVYTLPIEQHHLLTITPTTSEQKLRLHPYSNSRLTAMNQCPTWGVVSAQKRYPSSARSMALEAGALMHEIFAATRIWQLHRRQRLPLHATAVAQRLFGSAKTEPSYFDQQFDTNRWHKCWRASEGSKDERESLMVLAWEMLRSSGFKDNVDDDVRTIDSMELASIAYIDEVLPRMENFEIFVSDRLNAGAIVGIENVFDVVLTYDDERQFRFIGTLDGLTWDHANKQYTLEDNKTASRLDAGWKAMFQLSHQVTGYLACAAAIYGFDIYNARILGSKIKPSNRGEDIWPIYTRRNSEQFQRWAFWFRHTAEEFERYKDHYEYAPRYTHSCNRYFRPCSLMPFCGDTFEGRLEQWEQMVTAKQSPSELAAGEE